MTDSAFEAWYSEREGFSLRAERLTGPKDELQAAFEAGVAAAMEAAKQPIETAPRDGTRVLVWRRTGMTRPVSENPVVARWRGKYWSWLGGGSAQDKNLLYWHPLPEAISPSLKEQERT